MSNTSGQLKTALLLMLVAWYCPHAMPAYAETEAAISDPDPFVLLKGRWGGGGLMKLSRNRKARLTCKAEYSGSSSQLRLAINCKGNAGDVIMNARLSRNRNRLRGVWEEKTFRAVGTIAGKIEENRLHFIIGGNVLGRMSVDYTRSRQVLTITARGIPMKELNMTLTRR